MSTKLQICNATFIRCGNEPIESLTEDNKRTKVILNQYEITLKDLLNDTTWNFATSREVELTLDASSPAFGYGARYIKPSDVIRILELECNKEYRVEGDYVLTNSNAPVIKAKCIMFINDETKFSPSFTKTFILKLAEDVSYALVQSNSLKESISAELDRQIRKSRSYNSQEGTPLARMDNGLIFGERL